MTKYIAQRLLVGLLTAFIVSLLIFVTLHVAYDPVKFMICLGDCEITDEQRRMIREDLGLHGPLHMQYFRWMGWVTGDWGESFFSSENIWKDFKDKLPVTLQLAVMAQVIAALMGIATGILMALRRNSWVDLLGRAVFKMWIAFPVFWTATLLLVGGIYFFEWTPKIGYIQPLDNPGGNLLQLLWPALVLGLPVSAAVALMMRSSSLGILRQDYVQTTPASGLGHSAVVFLHALKNVLAPAVVTLALTFPAIVGGTVIMERIFVLDGVGNMLVEALNQRDFTVTESLALFFAVWVVAVNTLVDLLCGWLNPGVRSTRKPPREEWGHLANPVRLV